MAVKSPSASELESKVLEALRNATAPLKAVNVARAVGMTVAKDVNRTLYDLEKKGLVCKHLDGPTPMWRIDGSSPTGPLPPVQATFNDEPLYTRSDSGNGAVTFSPVHRDDVLNKSLAAVSLTRTPNLPSPSEISHRTPEDGGSTTPMGGIAVIHNNSSTATLNGTTVTSNGTTVIPNYCATVTLNGTTVTSNGTTVTSNGTTMTSNGTTVTTGTTETPSGTFVAPIGKTVASNGMDATESTTESINTSVGSCPVTPPPATPIVPQASGVPRADTPSSSGRRNRPVKLAPNFGSSSSSSSFSSSSSSSLSSASSSLRDSVISHLRSCNEAVQAKKVADALGCKTREEVLQVLTNLAKEKIVIEIPQQGSSISLWKLAG